MKRHQFMDLVWGNINEEIGEWKNIEDGLPQIESKGSKVKVRSSNDSETFAYFYPDMCAWIKGSGGNPCYFWDCLTKYPLNHVTHWKALKQ